LTTPAAIAYWGQRTVNDTQRYVDTVRPLIDEPQVQAAVVAAVTDAIEKQVDIESILNDAFSGLISDHPRLQALVGPLAGAVNSLIEQTVRQVVASSAFRDLWVDLNTRAQEALVRLLQGNPSGAVSLQGDQVVLDVSDVIDQVKQRLVDRGLTFVANVPVPQTDKQIVLITAPRLKQLRTLYAFTHPVARWLIWVVIALYLAAFALARRRPRMAGWVGIAVAANALLVAFLIAVGRQVFVNDLAGTTFGPASTVIYNTLLDYLTRGWQTFLWFGLLLVVAGWFAGTNTFGTSVRHNLARSLERLGAPLADGPLKPAGGFVAGNIGWLRVVAVVVGVVVLAWGLDVSPAQLSWAALVTVALLVALQVLIGVATAPPVARHGRRRGPRPDGMNPPIERGQTVISRRKPRSQSAPRVPHCRLDRSCMGCIGGEEPMPHVPRCRAEVAATAPKQRQQATFRQASRPAHRCR
jgi:hypothetical protein